MIINSTNKTLLSCLQRIKITSSDGQSSLATINLIKNNYMTMVGSGLNLLSKIGMILFTFYVIYTMKVPYLLMSFLGFFSIKIIGQYILSYKNPHINPMNMAIKQTDGYFSNVINNTPLLYLFNCKNVIIHRIHRKQMETLGYQNASCKFTETISSVFNIMDNGQWIINNILIVTSGIDNPIAVLFNTGLTTYFYQRLAWELSFHLPSLINNYRLYKLNRSSFNGEIDPVQPSIYFKDISIHGNKIIKDKYLLNNITLDTLKIKQLLNKEYVHIGVVGISGSGKTTLLKSIMGLEQLDNPIKFIDDNAIYEDHQLSRANYLDNIMYISQNKYILEDTLYNNLVLSDHPQDINKIKAILSILNIDKPLETIIHDDNISGGEKSRINMARSIINTPNPSLIIIDELEAALDGVTYKNIYDYMMTYNCNKIIATHDPQTMMGLDYIIVLHEGSIVFQGTPQEGLNNKYFQRLIERE
jgi:ABC-type bacteriocin/lantibiotic exporter with double-glycine peptidase domain